MTSPSRSTFISLAHTLPPRLLRFFARYPPGTHTDVRSNPFKPTVHAITKRWHNPIFSYRRQAVLCKIARQHGVEELLPPSRKSSAYKEEKLAQRAEGGVGRWKRMLEPKGKKWERTLHARLEKRKKAMEEMPALIEKWKRSGHGRGWKEWPR
ncbi:hypothetical protein L211DRAFT_817019 [Terfezia boudieri ATCC MYA-4762]|uniref:Large ribosomal subunit protein mL59 domain-containing protein n=1 Tax=Terfezia boudieri ATCC MYA-4762 TaxID=1051890 RepID=A0A3N4M7Q1_9PEZI|nr:hypothetical protein L211DRAFT_817019 [Terfezia boudieri ATCC MYA-4762]